MRVVKRADILNPNRRDLTFHAYCDHLNTAEYLGDTGMGHGITRSDGVAQDIGDEYDNGGVGQDNEAGDELQNASLDNKNPKLKKFW